MLEISRPAIEKHRAEKYATIIFGPPSYDGFDRFEGYHPLFLLDKIITDPSIASYVTEIQIHNCTSDHDDQDYGEGHQQKKEQLENIVEKRQHELVTQCSWLREERREEWQEALSAIHNQPHFIGILPTLLPNLESITMTQMTGDSGPITEIVDTVAAANRDPGSPLHEKALTKLLEVSLNHSDTEMGEDFGLYAPFTNVPSMRSIHGRMITEDYEQARVHPLRNDIEEIKIVYSAVDLRSWEWMLKSVKNLKRFGYHHAGSIVGNGAYDARGIVALLRQHASHSLRKLDLTTEETQDWDPPNPFIGDLKGFKVLRILIIDDSCFQTMTGQVMRLVDMLPLSLRVVTLLREVSGDAVDLFRGLAEGKQQGLLELKRIRLDGDYALPSSLFEKCRDAAIEILGPHLVLY
ncbi:MAG: hypothetical protein Q9221_009119 [Calogaya cf. arnoldii]